MGKPKPTQQRNLTVRRIRSVTSTEQSLNVFTTRPPKMSTNKLFFKEIRQQTLVDQQPTFGLTQILDDFAIIIVVDDGEYHSNLLTIKFNLDIQVLKVKIV